MKHSLPVVVLLGTLSACAPVVKCSAPVYLPMDLQDGSQALQRGDYATAIRQLEAVADTESNAQYQLGLIYEEGLGTQQDRRLAASLYNIAAYRDHPKAQFHFAYLLWEGIDRASTNSERYAARDWFSLASRQLLEMAGEGDPEAQYMLGYLYGTGKAFAIDRAESKIWFHRAAEQGHAKAQYELGRLYQGKYGPQYDDKDFAEALKWFHLAADSGYPAAQYHLGEAYRWGTLGLSADNIEAMVWYESAAAKRHEGASYARDELNKSMTPQELAAARRRTNDWCGPEGPDA